MIGKAEHLAKGSNPRFVVTSLLAEALDAQSLYEKEYCARGDMENRIKEQQLCLFAGRTSAATMRANEVRLWFSSVAYTLMTALRRLGLKDTDLANARCDTIRLKLLKIGAQLAAAAGRKLQIARTVRILVIVNIAQIGRLRFVGRGPAQKAFYSRHFSSSRVTGHIDVVSTLGIFDAETELQGFDGPFLADDSIQRFEFSG